MWPLCAKSQLNPLRGFGAFFGDGFGSFFGDAFFGPAFFGDGFDAFFGDGFDAFFGDAFFGPAFFGPTFFGPTFFEIAILYWLSIGQLKTYGQKLHAVMDEIVEWPFAPNAAERSYVARTKVGDQDTGNGKFEFSAGEVPWPRATEASKTVASLESMTVTFSPDESIPQMDCACGRGLE